mgnify:CR=1 FL=1
METTNLMKPDDALASAHVLRVVPEDEADALVREALGDPSADVAGGEVVSEAEKAEQFSDTANAASLVKSVNGRARYCASIGWMFFDGRRWAVDQRDGIIEEAKAVARANVEAAVAEPVDDIRKAMLKAVKGCLSEKRIKAMASLAQSDPALRVLATDFDSDPWLLNVLNGTIDLRTGDLRPHRPGDMITKLAPVEYDPAAASPTWEAFLYRILDGNQDLIRFLQEAVGYSLTGDVREQVVFLLYGTGANGKSTFLETLTDMLGDYWAKMNPETLMDQRRFAGSASEDIALLAGARLVTSVEVPAGHPLNTSAIKSLTGGDSIQARYLYKSSFTFRPQFKAFVAMNQKPTIHDPTEGIWRRIRLIPFTVTIPPEERDKKLPERLRGELPGILAWAVRGCLGWQQDGLSTPADVIAATEGYRKEQDVLAAFLADCCQVGPGLSVAKKSLVTAYTTWCQEAGEEPLSTRVFSKLLADRGFGPGRTRSTRTITGLTLIEPMTAEIGRASCRERV